MAKISQQKSKGLIKGNVEVEKYRKRSSKMKANKKLAIKDLTDRSQVLRSSKKNLTDKFKVLKSSRKDLTDRSQVLKLSIEDLTDRSKVLKSSSKIGCQYLSGKMKYQSKQNIKNVQIQEENIPPVKRMKLCHHLQDSASVKMRKKKRAIKEKALFKRKIKNVNKPTTSVPTSSSKVEILNAEVQKEIDLETRHIDQHEGELQIDHQQQLFITNSNEVLVCLEKPSKIKTASQKKSKICSFGRNQVLVCLKPSQQISFHGYISVQIIHGCLNVLGCTLIPDGIYHPVYSPSSHSFLGFTASSSHSEPFRFTDIIKKLRKLWKSKTLFPVTKKDIIPGSVIFILCKLKSKMCYFISHHCQKELFPKQITSKLHSEKKEILRKIGCRLVTRNRFVIPKKYETVVAGLCDAVHSQEVPPVFVVCGVKNIGKSSFIRYFINCLLQRIKCVQYLECDVGQSEFTPPGCLALLTVTKPLLGPSFTHLQNPERMCFYGDVAPMNTDHYLNCLRFVIENKDSSIPLIVNTMGYSRKIKYILANTLFLVQPSHVVQLKSDTENLPMPDFTPASALRYASRIRHQYMPLRKLKMSYKLLVVSSPVIVKLFRLQFRPFELRGLMLLSYLSQLQPVNFLYPLPLNMLPIHATPWKNIALHVCSFSVRMSDILRVFNASWVALCRTTCQEMSYYPESPDLPKFMKNTPICECLGFGIVRNIDMEKKLLLILTPLTNDELEKVNCLLKGNVDIPVGVLEKQLEYTTEEHPPYISKSKMKPSREVRDLLITKRRNRSINYR